MKFTKDPEADIRDNPKYIVTQFPTGAISIALKRAPKVPIAAFPPNTSPQLIDWWLSGYTQGMKEATRTLKFQLQAMLKKIINPK